ncbi:MAG: hypothetical protein KAW66_12700, partial [Candidatus Lokiarchaeota archaeon]|nr:hypothetical protein [Candidatus Lokiarchaeota archaeon]
NLSLKLKIYLYHRNVFIGKSSNQFNSSIISDLISLVLLFSTIIFLVFETRKTLIMLRLSNFISNSSNTNGLRKENSFLSSSSNRLSNISPLFLISMSIKELTTGF